MRLAEPCRRLDDDQEIGFANDLRRDGSGRVAIPAPDAPDNDGERCLVPAEAWTVRGVPLQFSIERAGDSAEEGLEREAGPKPRLVASPFQTSVRPSGPSSQRLRLTTNSWSDGCASTSQPSSRDERGLTARAWTRLISSESASRLG
jgi:hypothetical protein